LTAISTRSSSATCAGAWGATRRRFLAAAGLAALAPRAALAQAPGAIRFVQSDFESRFPQSMVFRLDATAGRPVGRITLNYRVAGRRTLSAADAQFSQAGAVHAEHSVDLSRRYLPPGTQLQFYWQVEDAQGGRYRSQTYQSLLDDLRFQWRQMRARNVELFWNRGDDTYGRILLSIASRALDQVAAESGVTLERPVKLFVYGDVEEFRSASYRGGYEWVGGTFYPNEGIILIYAPPNQQGADIARRAIPHELTHAVIHQVTDNPFGDVPQWLNEGLSTRAEPSLSPDQAEALASALANARLLSLKAIGGAFPVDPDEALLAYAQSHSAVTFLLETYGRVRLGALLQVYREGVTHDEGLQRALGFDTAELDRQWRAWLAPWAMQKVDPNLLPAAPTPAAGPSLVDWAKGVVESVRGQR
jgi:hypothetical protein